MPYEYTLVIKGTPHAATVAASNRGIALYRVRHVAHETHARTRARQSALADWFAQDQQARAPYAPGSLLYYGQAVHHGD